MPGKGDDFMARGFLATTNRQFSNAAAISSQFLVMDAVSA